MDQLFSLRTTAEWLALLGGEVPFAPVNDLAAALANPFAREVGMRDTVEHADAKGGKLDMLALPVKIDGARPKATRAPKLGEHTDEVLGKKR